MKTRPWIWNTCAKNILSTGWKKVPAWQVSVCHQQNCCCVSVMECAGNVRHVYVMKFVDYYADCFLLLMRSMTVENVLYVLRLLYYYLTLFWLMFHNVRSHRMSFTICNQGWNLSTNRPEILIMFFLLFSSTIIFLYNVQFFWTLQTVVRTF